MTSKLVLGKKVFMMYSTSTVIKAQSRESACEVTAWRSPITDPGKELCMSCGMEPFCSLPLYLSLCLSLRERWRRYLSGESWNWDMWRFLTVTRTGPSVAVDIVWWTLSFWIAAILMPCVTIKRGWRVMTCVVHLNTSAPLQNIFLSLYPN